MNVLRALYGLDGFSGGSIAVKGKAAAIAGPSSALAHGIGYMPIDRKLEGLALALSVMNNITMANIDGVGRGAVLNRKVERQKAGRWVKDVSIRTLASLAEVARISPDELRARLVRAGVASAASASARQSLADLVGPDPRRQTQVLGAVLAAGQP